MPWDRCLRYFVSMYGHYRERVLMNAGKPRVLNVGQCDLDHGNISRLLTDELNAEVERAASNDAAFQALKSGGIDLVLVNRVFDADGALGLEFIKRIKSDDATRGTPVLLVSNFAEAQDAAVALGAKRGFGKDSLASKETRDLLASLLDS